MKIQSQTKHRIELTKADICDILIAHLKQEGLIDSEAEVLKHSITESITIEVTDTLRETSSEFESQIKEEEQLIHKINHEAHRTVPIDFNTPDQTVDLKEVCAQTRSVERVGTSKPIVGNSITKDLFASG